MRRPFFFFKFSIFTILLLILFKFDVFAQDEATFRNLSQDGIKLGTAYAQPGLKAIGLGLTTGWSNSASTLKPWNLEIRLGGTYVFVPNRDQTFDISQLGLSQNTDYDKNQTIFPTLVGSKQQQMSEIEWFDGNTPRKRLTKFKMPAGMDMPSVPVPQIQFTLGLPFGSALMVRFVPRTKVRDLGKVGNFGLGFQKEIYKFNNVRTHHVFALSVLAAYNNIGYHQTLPISKRIVEDKTKNKADYDDQRLKSRLTAWNLELLAGYKIPFKSDALNHCFTFKKSSYREQDMYFEPFISVGYQNVYNVFNAYGNYNVKTGYTNGAGVYQDVDGQKYFKDVKSNVLNGLKETVGFNLNINSFRLYAAYTFAEYSSVNAGLGFYFKIHKQNHNETTGI